MHDVHIMAYDPFIQQKQHQPSPEPRSQGLSFLPPLVVGRKTLLAAGHVTTQNLGGKKSVGQEEWQSYLLVTVANSVGFKIVEQ